MTLVDRAYSTFNTQELERLAAYRGAVQAGVFSDWDGSAATVDSELLAWLLRPTEPEAEHGPTDAYPFTPSELAQLERCRQAVAGGYYSEDEPSAPRQV
jgi:hypothetical protein